MTTSYPSGIQSVARAFELLELMNRRAWSSVAELHQESGLPKPTVVRMLKTLMQCGYVAKDSRQIGYSLTGRVQSLSCGFHGDPMIVEVARPFAVALTRDLHWPVGVAILERDSVVIRLSTIPDTSNSPFHATLNMRLSLFANALGLAYYAFCPESERGTLDALIGSQEEALLTGREKDWLERRVERARAIGYAERDPSIEPRNSATVAVPIMFGGRVAATIGITYFQQAVSSAEKAKYVATLKETALAIEQDLSSGKRAS